MELLRGNDIKLQINVQRVVSGKLINEDLTNVLNLHLYISNSGRKQEIKDYTIHNNIIEFIIKGRDTRVGSYNLELLYETNNEDIRTTESNIFIVVEELSQIQESLNYNSIGLNTINIQSTIQCNKSLDNFYTKKEIDKLLEDLKNIILNGNS